VNSLPKTVTRQRRGCDLNTGPTAPESSTLTTRLPSHPMRQGRGAKVRGCPDILGQWPAARVRQPVIWRSLTDNRLTIRHGPCRTTSSWTTCTDILAPPGHTRRCQCTGLRARMTVKRTRLQRRLSLLRIARTAVRELRDLVRRAMSAANQHEVHVGRL